MKRVESALLICSMTLVGATVNDHRSLPPDPAAIHEFLAPHEEGIQAAIARAELHVGGKASSARLLGEGPRVEVLVATAEGLNFVVLVDLAADEVLSAERRGRFPGWPVEGPWTELPSGLKYFDVQRGDGLPPRGLDVHVQVHYTGYLVDGSRFESSHERGDPVVFRLDQVIAGWTEGVGTMRVGGRRKLIIPPELGYGELGSPPVIPGDATLIFDIELLALP